MYPFCVIAGISPPSDMAADDDDADDDDAVPSNEICVGNREGESDLILAVRANDCDRIQRLVWRGCDCNAVCKCKEVFVVYTESFIT